MTIGVDLRVLQTGHKYRGIGEVAKRTLKVIFEQALVDEQEVSFMFARYEGENDPLELLDVPDELEYEVVTVGARPGAEGDRGLATKASRLLAQLFGNPIKGFRKADVFLQFDYALGVPTNVKTVLVKHDIIPYLFPEKYFISPIVHIKNKAARTTLRTIYHNYTYGYFLRRALRHAKRIITVSDSTQRDLHQHPRLRVPERKMTTIHLGVDSSSVKSPADSGQKPDMPTKPYLLFVGAVDGWRRRVVDLIDAYNNLKAEGRDIQLVLVGENFEPPFKVLDKPTRLALKLSSYKKDIITPGYVSDVVKQELFTNAIAFVFPTIYEGFGIPILEAMQHGRPVITYKNSSIPEVGGGAAIYANDWQDIISESRRLLNMSNQEKRQLIQRGKSQASKFSWAKTGQTLYGELEALTE